jgi:ribosomal protein S27E
MPVILQKSSMEEVTVKKYWGRKISWYYYQCPECFTEEYKSDIPFKSLHCLHCGKVMQRNCHQVEAW